MSEKVKSESGGATVVRMADNLIDPKKYVAEIHNFPNGMAEFAVHLVGKEEHEGWTPAASEQDAREQIKAILAEAGIEMEPEEDEETDTPNKMVANRQIVTHQCGAGMDEKIKILVMDEPGPGNACHEYVIGIAGEDLEPWKVEQKISFQKGAVAEAGPNGISCEALLAVIIDRLEGFQSGPYPCAENAAALDHCRRAIRTLHKRTIDRANRSAEGKSQD